MSLDGWRKQAAWEQIVPELTAGNWEGTVAHHHQQTLISPKSTKHW